MGFYEVKKERGRISLGQDAWLHALNHTAPEHKAMVVRPSDWEYVMAELEP